MLAAFGCRPCAHDPVAYGMAELARNQRTHTRHSWVRRAIPDYRSVKGNIDVAILRRRRGG